MNQHRKAVLIDLDGTLIDHFNVIHRCYVHALGKLGKPIPDRETVKRSVGGSMEVTMRHFADGKDHEQAVHLFREHFEEIFLTDIVLMEGSEWLLENLREGGRKIAVFTNKQGPGSRRICDHLGISPYLDAVVGSLDTPFRKPERAFTMHVLELLETDADAACLIGDSPWDIGAAQSVDMPAYCVTTGTHTAEELRDAGADAIFNNFHELGESVFGFERP